MHDYALVHERMAAPAEVTQEAIRRARATISSEWS